MSDFFDRTLESLRKGPAGPLVRWMENHPRLSAWIVLAAGMVILVVIQARDIGLQPSQWAAVIIAVILVAGACVAIVSWEDEDEDATQDKSSRTPIAKAKTEQNISAADLPAGSATTAKAKKAPARSPTKKPVTKKTGSLKKSK